MTTIKVGKLKLSPLKIKNVYDLSNWEKYKDPLLNDYNFPDLDDYEIKLWYESRALQAKSKSFAVTFENKETIGLINIKNIRKILKTSNLGIVFNPKYIDQGYGTVALKGIIKYYFGTMNMRSLYLDVAKHNKRAIRCYEKCGFKIIKKYSIKLKGINIEQIPKSYTKQEYTIKNSDIYIYCYKMRISKNNYKSFL